MSGLPRDDLLDDLRQLADETAGYVALWTERQFLADKAKQRILERTLELMGEVATRLGDDAPDGEVDWQGLRDLRVILAHVYQRVDPRRLWIHATRDVPRLREVLGATE